MASSDPRRQAAAVVKSAGYGCGGRVKYARGGAVKGKEPFEGTKKDVAEDKQLAKEHGMSTKEWEKSPLDRKHDRQKNERGLKVKKG